MDQKNIRNFCIIAHIDHGKSTLADRILELTDTVEKREMKDQILDSMDLERERGITIKLNAVQLVYHAKDGQDYLFHLIDTPGHVDFTYEVSRSLAACDGAILVVDAAQGVQAQTLANVYLALENDLEILPVLNKVDLPSAQPEVVKKEIEDLIGLDCSEAVEISAKSGLNVDKVLEEIVHKLPSPKGDKEAPTQALVFDSFYDSYRGIIAFVSVKNGTIKPKDKIRFMATGAEYEVTEVGVRTPKEVVEDQLNCGDVGWVSAAIKNIEDVRVGDTITVASNPASEPLSGYREMHPMVYCGLYPVDNARYDDLKEALSKLKLNDAALHYEPETSQALGFGFRCGFLGLLHMDVVEERLEREYNLSLIATSPSVIYHVYKTDGTMEEIDNPSALPEPQKVDHIEEPYIRATIITATNFIGPIMKLCLDKRGELINQEYVSGNRVELHFMLPLGEIVIDFYDKLKSISKGYASFDYHIDSFRHSDLVKLDILLNGEPVDALSTLTHRDNAVSFGRRMCEKLKDLIPRQQFDIAIQAAIGAKIVARETVKQVRKDVTAKCYGGDVSRKRKLLEKQKKGKKRMKQIGNVEVPQKAFLAVLKLD